MSRRNKFQAAYHRVRGDVLKRDGGKNEQPYCGLRAGP